MNSHIEAHYSALIVDDNPFNREVFRYALESADYETSETVSAIEALTLLESCCFDLLVLDLQMPFMNGGTVLTAVRNISTHARMNVIVATANPHMVVGDIEDLADYVVIKPVDIHEFATLVERLKGIPHTAERRR